MSECIVCHQFINGDSAYFEHHLNACVDQQQTSTSTIPPPPSSSAVDSLLHAVATSTPSHRAAERTAARWSNLIDSSPSTTSFAEHHDQVASDRDLAVALSMQTRSEESSSSDAASEAVARQLQQLDEVTECSNSLKPVAGCPICFESWEELECLSSERADHVERCLEGSAMNEGGGDQQEFEGDQDGGVGEKEHGSLDSNKLGAKSKASQVCGTANMIPLLAALLTRSHHQGETQVAYLCHPAVEHVGSKFLDQFWACGYRNTQMIFASLRQMPCYLDHFSLAEGISHTELTPLPSISELQTIIQDAWSKGFDPDGAKHFGYKLIGRTKWIGTTEVYTALTLMGIRSHIVDFPSVPGPTSTHDRLVKWILAYFSSSSATAHTSSGSGPDSRSLKRTSPFEEREEREQDEDSSGEVEKNVFSRLMGSRGVAVHMTTRQPLYLQHQGHSRTVIGIEVGKRGTFLLLYDPLKAVTSSFKQLSSKLDSSLASSSTTVSSTPKRVKVDSDIVSTAMPSSSTPSALSESSKVAGTTAMLGSQRGVSSAVDLDGYRTLLEPYRVSLKKLSRKEEYQILYVAAEEPLSRQEILSRKLVAASQVIGSLPV